MCCCALTYLNDGRSALGSPRARLGCVHPPPALAWAVCMPRLTLAWAVCMGAPGLGAGHHRQRGAGGVLAGWLWLKKACQGRELTLSVTVNTITVNTSVPKVQFPNICGDNSPNSV